MSTCCSRRRGHLGAQLQPAQSAHPGQRTHELRGDNHQFHLEQRQPLYRDLYPLAQPYSHDQGVFAIFGNNLIVNPSEPGLSADAYTVQNVTIIATQ